MFYDSDIVVDMKRSKVQQKTLRLTILDARRKHHNIAIGHVIIPLRNVPSIQMLNDYTKNINPYSQVGTRL